ncbi:MAG: CBS domain-containing protein [Pseudomonadota bacterium]
MENKKVKDVMVPLAEYATVSREATLFEAVMALENVQKNFEKRRYQHRAVIVLDEKNNVVGKLSQNDVLRGIEPKYKEIGNVQKISNLALSQEFIQSIMKNFRLWESSLDNICRKAGEIKVKDIMYTPEAGEYVDAEASLDAGIHQLVVGYHQSLLVTHDKKVVGILRLTDVFSEVCEIIKTCKI